jgi:DNA-binding response OmpR family regulator
VHGEVIDAAGLPALIVMAEERRGLATYRPLNLLAEHSEIALLLTDVGLPGLNGRQLAEEARRRVPRLKVIYMTGYARNAIVHHGVLDAGVDLLAKPFTTDELSRTLQEVLRRATSSASIGTACACRETQDSRP